MSTRSQQRVSTTSLALLALAFVAAVAISNQLFKGWRIDLTEDNLYTLSAGTKNLLRSIDEPINLYFYYSDEATADTPSLRGYAERVREMLEEFADNAKGNIRVRVIDPLPFSEDEDRAAQFGLQAVQLGTNPDPVYLGLAGTDSIDNEEIISFFQPDKEAFLEYDIARLVSTLASPERSVIGLVSGIDIAGRFNPQTQRMESPWIAYQQAKQLFDIRNLGATFKVVPDDVSLLWIVQPKQLDDDTLYAIDQFVLHGGKAIIFVDPVADVDPVSAEGMPQGMPPVGQGSDLPALFDAWGVKFSSDEVVADAQLALQISGMDRRPVRHYGYLGVNGEFLDSDDIVTAELNVINVATSGYLDEDADAGISFIPLLTSSPSSQAMAATRFSFLPDPASLQTGFTAGGKPLVLAARVSGNLRSAFPDGPPTRENVNEQGDSAATNHLDESVEPANLIIVADVDMLSDHLWVQVQDFFGRQIANAFASNGAFVINALENLAGNSDLIGVRSRASFTRPFTRVEALRAEAESNFRATEQRLQSELAETERRLEEIQSSREDTDSILLTSEQEAEVDRFIDQRSSIRQELRAVQRGLDEDIDRLGMILRIINIGLIPFLLTLFALIAASRRNRRSAE